MSAPDSSESRDEVRCICESDTFPSAPASRFLVFLVDATLAGNSLEESVTAVEKGEQRAEAAPVR